ncbi:hypothetical protein GCM10022247_37380 [Allokutzneria multivorans]|uniref:Methyltransferase domain-containing protein n=1 Tax=Allokutzneria multivorans TaxID=1142134 RepID=A0ABP7SH45_9PSEU
MLDFRGRRLRIEVPDPDEVLFPTDCGLSLLAAVAEAEDVELAGLNVLDIGCGSGIYTVAALAAGAARVTALDINAASIEVTRTNVARNGFAESAVTGVTADLRAYEPPTGFDVVLTNPPHLPYDPRYASDNGLEAALIAGPDGRALYDTIVERADDLVLPGGQLVIAHSSLADVGLTTRRLLARGYECRTVEVCEMDIPVLAYAAHRAALFHRLAELRDAGRAEFDGDRFSVHVLAFRRPA